MALSVIAVSIRVSPLRTDDVLTAMFITSAPSRLPASSNEDWVRVEASKNRLIWVRPRSEARFFSICRLRSTNSSERSSRPLISSRESPSIPNRCRRLRTNADFEAMFIKAGSIGGVAGREQGRIAAGPQEPAPAPIPSPPERLRAASGDLVHRDAGDAERCERGARRRERPGHVDGAAGVLDDDCGEAV